MIRRLLLFILTLAAFSGSAVAALATAQDRDETLRGYVNPVETLELPFRVPRPGINLDLAELSEASLERIQSSPIHWLRHEFQRDDSWTTTTRIIERVPPEMELVAILPPNTGYIGDFVIRYAQTIDHYEISLPLDVNSVDYAERLHTIYNTIHANDRQAKVIATVSDSNALNALYEANIPFDALAFDVGADIYDLVTLRDVLTAHDDGQKAIWITNLPFPSTDYVTITSIFRNIEREWAWIGGIFLDWDEDAPTAFWDGLVTTEHAYNGLFPATTSHAQYSGVWTFGNMGSDIGWVNDSRLRLAFTGSDIALIVREGDYVATLYPSVNAASLNRLPHDVAGNPYLLLTSDSLNLEINFVPLASNLEHGDHILEVIADELVPDEAEPRWHLVGYAVSSGDLSLPYERQISIAWITAGIAFLAMIVTGYGVIQASDLLSRIWNSLNGVVQFGISIAASIALMIDMAFTWQDAIPQIFRRASVQLTLSLFTAGLIYLQPGVIITIIAALLLFLIVYNRIEYGLLLVILWSPFFLFPVELAQFAFPIVEIILFITVGAWSLKLLANYALNRQNTPHEQRSPTLPQYLNSIDYAVGLWVIIGGISILWAEYRGLAITEYRTLMIQPALFYAVFRTLHVDQNVLLRFASVLILAGFAVAAIGLLQFALGESIITAEEGARRLASVYGSPNNVGLFLGRCIPFALAFTLLLTTDHHRLVYAVALIVMLLAAVFTQSSGALFIGLPVAITIVLLLAFRRKAIAPLLVLGVVGIIGIIFALQLPRFSNLLDLSQGTDFYRLRVWDSALNIIVDHPFTGIGLDQFLYAFRGEYIMPDAWEEPTLSHPHNFLLDFWTRLGMLGVVWFVSTQVIFWRLTHQAYTHIYCKNGVNLAIMIGTVSAMANLLAHGLVDNSVFVIDLAYVFMLLLVFMANISAIDERVEEVV